MTERLQDLLTREAAGLDVPAPPSDAVISRGKVVRRRRRLAAGATALATVVAVGGGAALVAAGGQRDAVDPTVAAQQYQDHGAFAIGRDVYIGEQHVTWDQEVKAIYYSSVGVVVRSGADPDTGSGPSRYAVISPTGEIEPLEVSMADRIPGFEPDGDKFAYADNATSRSVDVVVHDIPSDEEVSRVTLRGTFDWGGWEAPPVSIDGDRVFVHASREGWHEVNWRTGEIRIVPGTSDVHESANGRYATRDDQDVWTVREWRDGAAVGDLPLRRGWYGFFSPDGRFLWTFPNEVDEPASGPNTEVYDVVTGASHGYDVPWERDDFDLGWTPDGDILIVDGDRVQVCGAATGECTERAVDNTSGGAIKIGGNPYES